MTDEKIPDAVLGALKGSGFPFQTAVAQVAKTMGSKWQVIASEYPSKSDDGEEQFLDLAITNGTLFLTIECKKTRKEIFTFLRPLGQGNTGTTAEFRCLCVERGQESEPRVLIYCEEWSLLPTTYSSGFCVVSTSESGRDQRLLERDARLLIDATDAYSEEFSKRASPLTFIPRACLFVSVIVTNAPIYTTRYGPHEVSLDTGELPKLPRDTESVQCVRLRTAFTSKGHPDMGDRSVFVVNASRFSTLLGDLTPAPPPFDEARDRVRVRPRRP
jgi:hypothetical protein